MAVCCASAEDAFVIADFRNLLAPILHRLGGAKGDAQEGQNII
jgi:hypothetical protein